MIVSEKRVKIDDPKKAAAEIQSQLIKEGEDSGVQEHFWVIGLNNKNVSKYIDMVSLGTVSETIVHPREIYRNAVKRSCTSILLVHNHPSGVLTPSKEDISTNKRLVEAGKVLGIEVLDHIIIPTDDTDTPPAKSYLSLREDGYM